MWFVVPYLMKTLIRHTLYGISHNLVVNIACIAMVHSRRPLVHPEVRTDPVRLNARHLYKAGVAAAC